MKKFLLLSNELTVLISLVVFLSFSAYTQAPIIEWQNTIGGNGIDELSTIIQTSDNGFFLGGNSASGISGDKTSPSFGMNDFWVIKTDQSGNIQWQQTFGGDGEDRLTVIVQNSDDSYLIGGYSASGLSGNKTEISKGEFDYWIIKLDVTGAVIWQKDFGGFADDVLTNIMQTEDAGYLIAGYSISEISGDRTAISNGLNDYWILKLDATGNIQWQKSYGGISQDILQSIDITSDGGFLLSGNSSSGISGDKSMPCYGWDDYWVIKTDASGNIEWQKTIGGTHQELLLASFQTNDGGYFLAGSSYSNIGFDKSENCIGVNDYWVVKIDQLGNIIWQNTIGGYHADELKSAIQTSDFGYLIGGWTYSGISGDKSEKNKGHDDYWILKLDEQGNIIWQNGIGGTHSDELFSLVQTSDEGFVLGGFSNSGITGDKTESAINKFDYWIVKLFPETGNCFSPNNIITTVLPDRAKIEWTAVDEMVGNKIRYRISGTNDWLGKTVMENNYIMLNGLACNTDYEWQILSMCSGDVTTYSDYSPLHFFTTAACRLGGEEKKGELTVYPNPASDQVNISFTGQTGDAIIRIFNMNGEIVYENNLNIQGDYQLEWKAENISSGIYQLQIIINENNYTKKIVISK